MSQRVKLVQRRMEELLKLRYSATVPLGPLTAQRVTPPGWDEPGAAVASASAATPIGASTQLSVGDRWGQRDAIYDLRFPITIPPAWRDSASDPNPDPNSGDLLALHIDLSHPPSAWTINTVEGLLLLDEQPFHALDRYHREIILPPAIAARPSLDARIRAWTGVNEDSHTIHTLELRRLNPAADRLARQLALLLDAHALLPAHSPTALALLDAMLAACDQLDFTGAVRSTTPATYASCQRALATLDQRLHALARPADADAPWQPRVHATGHAHIDVAWLWRLRHTRIKTANTFSTALYLMERHPDFIFTHSTPQLYEWIAEEYPQLYARIADRVRAGQWEAEGAMWVEADTNITGGESLVRQFLFGQRFFREAFGFTSKVLWLPDVFGYSAALPQLIKGAGADYFVTTKISWNDTNRIPMDTFWWQGLDGTEVLSYFITARNEDEGDRFFTYNAELRPSVLMREWRNYRQGDLNRDLLLAYGYGDGGGGPTRDMIESLHLLGDPISPEIPTVHPGRVRDFMERLDAQVRDQPHTPHWVGELYLEYHRGTYTSQAHVKRGNRLAERALHNTELLASIAWLLADAPYPHAALSDAWKLTLTNQFHDILPGSSIAPVYSDAAAIYQRVTQLTDDATAQALAAVTPQINAPDGALVVWNPLSWRRDALIEIPAVIAPTLGLSYQPLDDERALALAPDAPSLGYRAYAPTPSGATRPLAQAPLLEALIAQPGLLENTFYRIEFNANGQITRLLDKSGFGGAGRDIIPSGQRANHFQLFEDKPLDYDAWDIDAFYERKQRDLDTLISAEVIETGPIRAAIRFTWRHNDRTTITQRVYLYAASRRIDFATEVEWHERQTLLKVAFPVAVHNARATAEIQFGSIERPTHRNTSWDQARFEACAHKWVDLSEGDYGVALLNDCKYGYDIHDATLRLTLLKGAISPDPHADEGRHEFTYSLFPHIGGWFEGGVHRAAYELNYPALTSIHQGAPGALPPVYSLAQVDAPNAVIETVKQSEHGDALALRLYECANRRGPLTLTLDTPIASAHATNLLEDPLPDAPTLSIAAEGHSLTSALRPFGIQTLLLRPRR